MGEYKKLVALGVYCKGCGCFTNIEPGHVVYCDKCKAKGLGQVESV